MKKTVSNHTRITIIDAIMGTGKSTYLIEKVINAQPQRKFLIVLPTLSECERYNKETTAQTVEPQARSTKSMDLQRLIRQGVNVVTTHSLIQNIDETTLELLRENDYALIIDECLDTVHKYENKFTASDMKSILTDGYVYEDEDGFLHWNETKEEELFHRAYHGRWDDIKRLCHLKALMCLRKKNGNLSKDIIMWTMPIEFFTLFKECYVATYLWNGSIQKNYFDLNHISYKHMTLSDGELVEYNSKLELEKRKQYFELINICSAQRLNAIGKSEKHCRNPLSSSWYKRLKNSEDGRQQLQLLKRMLCNYVRNIVRTPSDLNMWTTFKEHKSLLRGAGYTKGFVPLNSKGTNDYRNKESLAYMVNLFIHPDLTLFFNSYGIQPNEDLYALSELLQWIWRSRIRDGKPINLYLPSSRMRNLISRWASGEL